jgi:hypothetical protein
LVFEKYSAKKRSLIGKNTDCLYVLGSKCEAWSMMRQTDRHTHSPQQEMGLPRNLREVKRVNCLLREEPEANCARGKVDFSKKRGKRVHETRGLKCFTGENPQHYLLLWDDKDDLEAEVICCDCALGSLVS